MFGLGWLHGAYTLKHTSRITPRAVACRIDPEIAAHSDRLTVPWWDYRVEAVPFFIFKRRVSGRFQGVESFTKGGFEGGGHGALCILRMPCSWSLLVIAATSALGVLFWFQLCFGGLHA